MPRKTDGEKLDVLDNLVAKLVERLNTVVESVGKLFALQSATDRAVADLRREHERELALLKRDIEELRVWRDEQKKAGDERGKKLAAFGPPVLGALVNVLLAAVVARK